MRRRHGPNPDSEALRRRRHAPGGPGALARGAASAGMQSIAARELAACGGDGLRVQVCTPYGAHVRVREQAALAFRTRDDVAVLWLAVLGLVAAMWGWASMLPVLHDHPWVRGVYWLLVAAWGSCAAWVALVGRGEIALDAAGLRFRSLLRRERVAWRDVEEVRLVRGGFFRFPAVILRLRRPRRLLPLSWTDPRQLRIGLHWERREELLGELAARTPHARSASDLAAYLERPHRVAWQHRLTTLAGAALSAAFLGYAFVEALTWDSGSFLPIALALASCAVCCTLAGGAIDAEWRWKSCLIRAGGVLGLAIPSASLAAICLGACGPLVLALAACFGWAVVSVVVALPIRPRGRWVAAAYAAAMAAALVPAWWYGAREPLPSRGTEPLTPGPSQIVWSLDGEQLYGVGKLSAAKALPVCHVVDAASLRVRSLPLGDFRCCWLYPTGGPCVLYRATPFGVAKGKELWALDTRTGERTWVHAAPFLSVASEGRFSPDGQEVLFLAGSRQRKEAFVLRLADLSVRRLEPGVDLSRFDSVHWGRDGRLLLAERPPAGAGAEGLAFWSLAPGDAEPSCLYRATAPFLTWTLSPDVRWALVGSGPDGQVVKQCEIVDLATGARRALPPPLPGPAVFPHVWSPDGAALAYAAAEGRHQAVIVVDPATGQARRVHETRDRDIAFVSLSSGARYVACAVNRGMGAQGRIIDTRTGQAIRLNGIGALQPLVWLAWSPERPSLAVASFGSSPLSDRPTALRVYDVQP